ncbi:DHS-like NAD/FAD-binding domain-containing protein [Epithele typhae]|uniref:DHS-like NAD/FAD-binding domain-containing protein n=1 Tax=Epithele typhae TaxID=378194 RepID=UPI0020079699|nr:DHS-like NAD/FAD-binding domain-containing protein [Epithele typhae]KAH9922822.1 DHS-like NAD/FAD-binding domain-containing protein [Epithele typhae]
MTVTLDLDASSSDASTRKHLYDLSLSVAKCKKIIVVSGAGISCSCGIPDFRSSDGLYALVKQQYPDVVLKGRDLFDSSLFRDPTSTSVFYTFISQLKKSIDTAAPSPTHNKLLRSYTQNIDGLEERAGLVGTSREEVRMKGPGSSKIRTKGVRNVQLHGNIHRVRCTYCSADYPCDQAHLDAFLAGNPPDCPDCAQRSSDRVARSARAIKVGTLRPAVVLYDEPHPLGDDIGTIQTSDIARKPDMLIIMGTSLKVHGFKKLVKEFARAVHESRPSPSLLSGSSLKKTAKSLAGKVVFVNKTSPGSEWDEIIDYHVSGETDRWVERVLEEWKKARPSDWEIQQTLVATGEPSTSGQFRMVKEITNTMGAKAKDSKRKNHRKRENLPAPVPSDDVFDITLPLPSPPSSPSKRSLSRCHYNNVESSPSKRSREGGGRAPQGHPDFEARGLLFGNSTNATTGAASKARPHPGDDSIDMGANPVGTPRQGKAAKKQRVQVKAPKAPKSGAVKVVVKIPPRRPAGRKTVPS